MRKQLGRLAKKLLETASVPAFDPATIGDPVAMTTDWKPLKGGGANFKTHKLDTTDPTRMEFKAASGAKVFYAIFVMMGLIPVIIITSTIRKASPDEPLITFIIPVLMAAVFMTVGFFMLRSGTKPIVFDRRAGFFWRGRTAPHETFNRDEIKDHAELDQIHALQILSEYIRGNKSSYYSYEINLVLKDGRRVHVVDHGNIHQIREDAAKIGEFLGRPVWDAA